MFIFDVIHMCINGAQPQGCLLCNYSTERGVEIVYFISHYPSYVALMDKR